MSRKPEEEKHTEVKKIIAGVEYIKCTVCFNFFRTEDLNRHLWSHAWTKYESLPARKKTGRFKQLMKFISKQYKVRATNSNSRDLEEIHQRRKFYEKYPRDVDPQSSVKSSPVPNSSSKSTPTSETRSGINESTAPENIPEKGLEENLDNSKESNDFDMPPLEEIPKFSEHNFLDDSPKKSDQFSVKENEGDKSSPKKKSLARTNSGKRGKNEPIKPEELLVDSAESLDLGPSDISWNKWEERLDSEQQDEVQDEPSNLPVESGAEKQPEKQTEVPNEDVVETVEPEKEPMEKRPEVENGPSTPEQSDDNKIINPEVPKNDDEKQVAEPMTSKSDSIKEFSDDDNELMIDENFVAGQEFVKFRNRSLDNDDVATANGPISDILENAAALSGVSPESETSKTEITNDFEIEKVETMNDECIEISDEDDDVPITTIIQSNNYPQTGKLRNFLSKF